MNKEVKVTVIIPVYNSEKYIGRCLDSVINQTYKNIDIMVINDGSKDNSQKIIEEYVSKYKNIELINQENKGVSKTRNEAIKRAKTKYIMFIDNDDFIDEDYIEVLLKSIEEDDFDVVISGYRRPNENGRIIKELRLKDTEWSKMMILAPWSKIYKREYLIKNDIEFLQNNIGEDIYFNLQALFLSNKVKSIDYIGYNWFFNTKSVSNTIQKDFRKIAVFRLLDECYEVIKNKKILENNYEIMEMHFIRYIIWFLSFSTKKVNYKSISEEYYKLFNWLYERFPNYKNNKMIGVIKPEGEALCVRLELKIFMILHKVGLGKMAVFIYSRF